MSGEPTEVRPVSGVFPRLKGFFLLLAAGLSCLVVLALNGGVLYHFDSGSYVVQGISGLEQFGFDFSSASENASGATSGNGTPTTSQKGNSSIHGSRSLIYAIVIAAITVLADVDYLVVFNSFSVFLTVLLPISVCLRLYNRQIPATYAISVPILAASMGALPFYTAYAMPDVFAAILLIVAATYTAFVRKMRVWEILLGIALAVFAVVSHPSHFLMAILLIPLTVIGSVMLERRRWWIAPLLVAFVATSGLVERVAFKVAVEKVADSEVFYSPYLTARLIADGPGYAFLEENCPDPTIETCALYDALQLSDNPRRLTASHIAFESDPDIGSFKRMSEEDQQRVGADQFDFFVSVMKSRPIAMTLAIFKNAFDQAQMYKINQTIPSATMVTRVEGYQNMPKGTFVEGRLTREQSWTNWVYYGHSALYAASLFLITALLIWPGALPGRLRVMTLMILFGILVNALICGGLSQPADRYGARVIWLLPFMATVLVLFRGAVKREQGALS